MTYRIPVTMTDEFRDRLTAYATEHGASMSGALVALATGRLDQLDDEAVRDRLDVAAAGRGRK